MSSADKSLSHFSNPLPDGSANRIGIVVAEWNEAVTGALLAGCRDTLTEAGVKQENILTKFVPGTFELALGAQLLCIQDLHAVICLGCVVQGETRHFDFICDAAAQGIMRVGLDSSKPVIFGVLTTDDQEQALERAGGKHGNKGSEAAYTALRMLEEFK